MRIWIEHNKKHLSLVDEIIVLYITPHYKYIIYNIIYNLIYRFEALIIVLFSSRNWMELDDDLQTDQHILQGGSISSDFPSLGS